MLDKLIGGKKKREADTFTIPEKKYTTDPKILSKMASKTLLEVFHDQEKYIAQLADKLSNGRQEYERLAEKNDELVEKVEVVNSQIVRMTNEHEQLTIKFDNLQSSLEFFSSENETSFRKEIEFLKQQEGAVDKIKNMNAVLGLYRQKFSLCKKIEQQNRTLKGRYAEMQELLEEAEGRIKAFEKDKSYNNLIPSLMQEIKELKSTKEDKDLSDRVDQLLQQQTLGKDKSQPETASTARFSSEDLLQKQSVIDSLNAQLSQQRNQVESLQRLNEEASAIMVQYEERLTHLENEVLSLQNQNQSLREESLKRERQYEEQSLKIECQASERTENLTTQLQELKEQHRLLELKLQKAEQNGRAGEDSRNQLMQENEMLAHQLEIKVGELSRERENRTNLESTLNSSNSSEIEHLLTLKNKLEGELQDLKNMLEGEKKQKIESQARIKKLSEQVENLRGGLKRMAEEKAIIQENASNCLKIAQEEGQIHKKEIDELNRVKDEAKKEVEGLKKKTKECEEQVKNFTIETEKLFRTVQTKDNELRKAYANSEQLEREKGAIKQQIVVREEEERIKARKYESELNQQRIKIESLTRKLTIMESKGEENKVSMDGMYEQLLAKDKKISQMEVKLKQYKYKIQLLRKEKQDIESTYENKLSHLQPEENALKLSQSQEEEKTQRDRQGEEERELLKNELTSLKEQNKAILAENSSLREQIEETQALVKEREKSMRLLQQKRDNIMKEMERMRKKSSSGEPMSAGYAIAPKQFISGDSREKRIASKALKGFEIVLKLLHQFYKTFVSVFAQRLEEQQIKGLQKEINAVIKRSSDMKDVFEGYLE